MASNELAIRFTETKYATKSEVAKELRTSLVDTFWHNILAYRSNFNRYLSIKSIDKNMFVFCACQSVEGLVNSIESKINRINQQFSNICTDQHDIKYYQDKCLVKSLRAVANKNDLEVTEPYLRSLINGELKEVAASHQVLVNYLNTIRYAEKKYRDTIDDNYLASLFQKFYNMNEITLYYRNREDTNRENRVIIDRIYTCAPIHLIDSMMNQLFGFISNSPVGVVAKALITYFYMNYVRPFNNNSDEFAIILAKSILAHDFCGDIAFMLPLESLMRNTEEIGKLYVDVQKTNDVTYFVNYMGKILDKLSDEVLDDLANLSVEILRRDNYVEDKEPEAEIAPEITTYTSEEFKQPIPEPVPEPVKPVEEPIKVVQEEQKPIIKEEKRVEPAPIKEEKQEPEQVQVKVVKQELAVSYIPPALDEKEAYRLEVHLRESDPSLKKKEAKFYARHCVVGKKYTIQQFKKYIGCAYETARTSMDHLADLGYYRKEQVKNKFVYSPIPR